MDFCSISLKELNKKGNTPKKRKFVYYSYLLFYLDKELYKAYKHLLMRENMAYCLYRNKGYKIIDFFAVVRSSAKCYKMIYINDFTGDFYCASRKNACDMAKLMNSIFYKINGRDI